MGKFAWAQGGTRLLNGEEVLLTVDMTLAEPGKRACSRRLAAGAGRLARAARDISA